MKTTSLFLVSLSVLAILGCRQSSELPNSKPISKEDIATAANRDQITACFDNVLRGLVNRDGIEVSQLVSQETLDYYEMLRQGALTLPAEKIRRLRLVDKFGVLMLRQRMASDDLANMSGRELFIHAVDNGWNSTTNSDEMSLGEITVSGDSATAAMVVDGETQKVDWRFVKEGDVWKLDMTSMIDLGNWAYTELAKQSGAPEDLFVLSLIRTATGENPSLDIWEPLQDKGKVD